MDGDWYGHGLGAISLRICCWVANSINLYNAAPQLLSINNDYHNKYLNMLVKFFCQIIHGDILKDFYDLVQLKTPQLDSSINTFINVIYSIDQPQGVHKIKTTLLSTSLPKLHELQSVALESANYDSESAEYRVTAIVLDTAQYRLFRPVHSDLLSTDVKTHLIKLDFINKGIDAVNLPSILRIKSVNETMPTYFEEKKTTNNLIHLHKDYCQ